MPSTIPIYLYVEIDASNKRRLHCYSNSTIPSDCTGSIMALVETEVDDQEIYIDVRGSGRDWDAYADYNIVMINNLEADGFPTKYDVTVYG